MEAACQVARRRFLEREAGPLLLAKWERALFMHFAVPTDLLQRQIPFELDLFENRAWVSLVAFTMRDMRLARGGRLGRWLLAPLAEQRFLNVRTYVRHQGEPGIFFIAEWMSNALCVPFGPLTYGLPYRWGRLEFEHAHERGPIRGRVESRREGRVLEYHARSDDAVEDWRFNVSQSGSLDAFLVERYAAFTRHGARLRTFRIWHEPWPVGPATVECIDDDLLRATFPWWPEARFDHALYSPGVDNIWIGPPRNIHQPGRGRLVPVGERRLQRAEPKKRC